MPTTIDRENAKQIRQPMDVLITMQVPDDDITLSFSGYTSTSKVSDGRLTQPTWPMRRLADLQGDGFALSGSCALYESLTPSATNGKLGVRGHVGQAVNLTVTGSQQMAGLTLLVTGASAVTYNGYSHEVTSGRVSFLVGATTAALTLTPASEETRIEISSVNTGADITISNDSLISCIVSLRSDLSAIDPTLPESEINVEAYFDRDVSEAVAGIPDDTPVYYRAGYGDDLSQTRSFYVSGEVTWADNVLSIHAVDAVHFLDYTIPAPLELPDGDLSRVYSLAGNLVREKIPNASTERNRILRAVSGYYTNAVIPAGTNVRDYLAFMSNALHADLTQTVAMWPTYTDAGNPSLTISKPSAKWSVSEEDCGDIKKNAERSLSGIVCDTYTVGEGQYFTILGTASMVKNVGVSINFDSDVFGARYYIGIYVGPTGGEGNREKYNAAHIPADTASNIIPMVPGAIDGYHEGRFGYYPGTAWQLTHPGVAQSDILEIGHRGYSQFIPWDCYYDGGSYFDRFTTQQGAWNELLTTGIIDSNDTQIELTIAGYGYTAEKVKTIVGTGRKPAEISNLPYMGVGRYQIVGSSSSQVLFPEPALENLLERSNITGSFTWKGDPRMQPRDVINFHRLDGTVEEVTIESITLKHEGGGTSAEIVYRKGVV